MTAIVFMLGLFIGVIAGAGAAFWSIEGNGG